MFTTVGWMQNQIGNPGLVVVAALPDPHVRVVVNDVVVPAMNKLIGVFGSGATLVAVQLQAPSLRRFMNFDARPVQAALLPTTVPAFCDKHLTPITLDADEALNAFVTDTAGGAERDPVLAWLGDGNYAVPAGEVFTIRAASATAAVAFAWTNVPMVFAQALPAGKYSIVGFRAESANMIAARLVGVGYQWRPGCLGYATGNLVEPAIFRNGRLGEWMTFNHNTPPTVDILCMVADAAQIFHLDLIKVQ